MSCAYAMKGGVSVEYLDNLPITELLRKLDIIKEMIELIIKKQNVAV